MKDDLETISEDYRLLWSKCTEEQKQKIYQIRENVRKNPAKYGLVAFEEAVMCLSKYNKIRELVSFPKETRIIDCGCGEGLQQVLFQDCRAYIGIDLNHKPKSLNPNCTFIQGNIKDVLNELTITRKDFGISVLCCSYSQDDVLDVFKQKFTKFVSI